MKFAKRNGFTLIELLIVISIIALLIGITLPSLANARKSAHAMRCSANMKQMTTALVTYTVDYDGYLPYPNSQGGETPPSNPPPPDAKYWSGAGWLYDGPIQDGRPDPYEGERRSEGALYEYLNSVDAVYHCTLDDVSTLTTGISTVGTRYMSSYVMNRAMNGWNATLPDAPAYRWEKFANPSNSVAMWEGDETFTDLQTGVSDPTANPNGHWNDGNNDPGNQGPSLRHNEAGTIGFLDGHGESWSWLRYVDVAFADPTQPNELFCNPGDAAGGDPNNPR